MIEKQYNKKNKNISTFLGIIIYRILTDISYFNEIVITYSSYGFKDYRNTTNLILSWVVTIIFSVPIIKLINREKITFSSIVVFTLALISIIPFATLIYSGILNTRFIIMNIIYWIVFLGVYLYISKKEVKPIILKVNNIKINEKYALILGVMSICLVMYISYKYTGFRLNFNLFNVYELRTEAISYNFPTILQYLFAWTRSINIIFIAYSIINRRYFTAAIFFIAQMFSFGIDGLKSTFFMAILVVLFCFIYNKEKLASFKRLCLWGVTGLSFLGVIEKLLLKTSNIITLLIRRVLVLPVYLNSCYVDFFSKNPPDYFKSSFLRFFGFETDYYRLDHIIGAVYFNNPAMGCNNGLISEGVTNFGIIGIIIMPILLILVLRIMDKCAGGLNEKVFLVIALYFAITISNSFLTTALLTHGLFISTIVFIMLKNEKNNI